MRLLAGMASLGKGRTSSEGTRVCAERPMKPLLDALHDLGAWSQTEGGLGFPPVTILGGGIRGGKTVLRDIESSQYVSSLLIAAPFAAGDVTLVLEGRIPSLPYVALTIETMGEFGVKVIEDGPGRYVVPMRSEISGARIQNRRGRLQRLLLLLPPPCLKGRIRVENINPQTRQGDIRFLDILERLGSRVQRGEHHVEFRGGELPIGRDDLRHGRHAGHGADTGSALGAAARRSLIRNVAHLRLKESDRLAALVNELRRPESRPKELADGMAITGGKPRGATIETYNDHRIAMSFAILGLAVPGMKIGEECVGKSFPGFWTAWKDSIITALSRRQVGRHR